MLSKCDNTIKTHIRDGIWLQSRLSLRLSAGRCCRLMRQVQGWQHQAPRLRLSPPATVTFLPGPGCTLDDCCHDHSNGARHVMSESEQLLGLIIRPGLSFCNPFIIWVRSHCSQSRVPGPGPVFVWTVGCLLSDLSIYSDCYAQPNNILIRIQSLLRFIADF